MPKLFACLYYQKKSTLRTLRTLGMRRVLKKLEKLTASASGH
jgi:hypothetical protein